MNNFSKTSLFPVEDEQEYYYMYNYTWISNSSNDGPNSGFSAVSFIIIFSTVNCITGVVGNGIVTCLLGFYIKRTPFTVYVLNLALADLGVLLCIGLTFILSVTEFIFLNGIAVVAAFSMHNTSELLLTAISIDRCVSVLFPIWYRCHRPPHLSTIVCALIWVLSCLTTGTLGIISISEFLAVDISFYPFITTAILCLPVVTVSTMLLLSKVLCKSRQPRRGRLLTIVFLTLIFFLIFAFPCNAILTLNYFTWEYAELRLYGILCTTLNSCVNPVIYFMVGRKKTGRQRQSLKVILQRAFKE